MARRQGIILAIVFHSQEMETYSLPGRYSTMIAGLTQAMYVSLNGMVPAGHKSALILMLKPQVTGLALLYLYQITAANVVSER